MTEKILFYTTGKVSQNYEPKRVQIMSNSYRNNKNIFDLSEEDKVNGMYEDLKNKLSKFKVFPYISNETLNEHFDKLMYIQDEIYNGLSEYENFKSIDFCDVSASGIQVRLSHKQIERYTYGKQITIEYDFSNYLDVPSQVIKVWKEIDTPEKVDAQQRFIEDGERWGWD